MPQLGQGLGLNLPDPLSGNAELAADLLERPRVPVRQPEPQLNDPLLAQAHRDNYVWLRDFEDDEVLVSQDLYEVVRAFADCRPSA